MDDAVYPVIPREMHRNKLENRVFNDGCRKHHLVGRYVPLVYRHAVSASGSGILEADKSTFILRRRVTSHTNALADAAKVVLLVCSLTHFTAGLEQIDRYDRGPEEFVSSFSHSMAFWNKPWYSQLVCRQVSC